MISKMRRIGSVVNKDQIVQDCYLFHGKVMSNRRYSSNRLCQAVPRQRCGERVYPVTRGSRRTSGTIKQLLTGAVTCASTVVARRRRRSTTIKRVGRSQKSSIAIPTQSMAYACRRRAQAYRSRRLMSLKQACFPISTLNSDRCLNNHGHNVT